MENTVLGGAVIAGEPLPKVVALFNGKYTLQNRETGEHRTFRVKTQAADASFAPGQRIVALLTGANNEADYTGFGFVTQDGITVWTKKRGDGITKTAWEWYAEMLWTLGVDGGHSPFADKYSLMMEGACCVCNRALTTPESIKSGLGPICADK